MFSTKSRTGWPKTVDTWRTSCSVLKPAVRDLFKCSNMMYIMLKTVPELGNQEIAVTWRTSCSERVPELGDLSYSSSMMYIMFSTVTRTGWPITPSHNVHHVQYWNHRWSNAVTWCTSFSKLVPELGDQENAVTWRTSCSVLKPAVRDLFKVRSPSSGISAEHDVRHVTDVIEVTLFWYQYWTWHTSCVYTFRGHCSVIGTTERDARHVVALLKDTQFWYQNWTWCTSFDSTFTGHPVLVSVMDMMYVM